MSVDSISLPHVSIAIPVFNLERYVADALMSVQLQSYQGQISVIVCDDGSTDGSLEVVRRIADRADNIYVYRHENQGRALTRNRLLDLAKTELVAWLDGDDLASSRWIEDQVAFLQANEDCVAVSAHGYAMSAKNHAISPIKHPLDGEEIDRLHLSGQASAFFQSCVLVKKSAVQKAGAYDPQYHCAEDYSLWLRLAEVGRLANIDAYHLFYRVHSTSANWTLNIEQRTQGHLVMNQARVRRGLEQMIQPSLDIPLPQKDDWDRRIYWINTALKSGNPYSAIRMLFLAIRLHPSSLLLWLFAVISICDCLLFGGNTVASFGPGKTLSTDVRSLPRISCYRLFRFANRQRRRLLGKH